MKLILSILVITSFVACSKSNTAAPEETKVSYSIQIEAVDKDGKTTTSETNVIKL